MTLKIFTLKNLSNAKNERRKDKSNTEKFQWDYKGLTFLDNNRRHINYFSVIKENISVWLSYVKLFSVVSVVFQRGFSGFSVWLDFSAWFSVHKIDTSYLNLLSVFCQFLISLHCLLHLFTVVITRDVFEWPIMTIRKQGM